MGEAGQRPHHRRSKPGLPAWRPPTASAVREPIRAIYLGAVQVYPWGEGALYRLYAAPGAGQRHRAPAWREPWSRSPPATPSRWIIGDTASGSGPARRTHVLVKPSAAGLRTNFVIATDRRIYHVEAVSTDRVAMAAISWTYPEDDMMHCAEWAPEALPQSRPRSRSKPRTSATGSMATRPPWRPVRAFDDGRQTFIEFPAAFRPGRGAALVHHRRRRRGGASQLPGEGPLLCGRPAVRGRRAPARRQAPADRPDRPRRWPPPLWEGGVNGAAEPLQPLAAKEDPETLVLRGRPRPAVRFRRGLIVGITGAVAVSLVTVSWLALEPPSFRGAVASIDDGGERASTTTPDALADVPKSYSDVPRLGPPLPGDLGRAILDRQRSQDEPMSPFSQGEDEQPAAQTAAEFGRERAEAARQAARTAGLMVQLRAGEPQLAAAGATSADLAGQPPAAETVPTAVPAAQKHKVEFAGGEAGSVSSNRLVAAPSPWVLSAGTFIPASLITGLNSDLPGMVLAQVTENVRDSATGRTVLIPRGARLIGKYDSVLAFGQRRALLIWNRIVFPDGSSIELDHVPATDAGGYSGVADGVDFHSWQLLKGIGMATLLGVGTQLGFGGSGSDLVRALRESAQENAAHAGDQITSRNLDVQPTITVRPGWPVRALVSKDLVLEPWRG